MHLVWLILFSSSPFVSNSQVEPDDDALKIDVYLLANRHLPAERCDELLRRVADAFRVPDEEVVRADGRGRSYSLARGHASRAGASGG